MKLEELAEVDSMIADSGTLCSSSRTGLCIETLKRKQTVSFERFFFAARANHSKPRKKKGVPKKEKE